MDEAMKRFPHLIEQIIQKIDDKGLVKSREVSRRLQEFVDAKEYPWLRIVKIPTRLKSGNIYLHLAAEYGQFGMFEWILESETKAPIRISNPLGLTIVIEDDKSLVNENSASSFLVACYSGRVKIAEMLLKKLDILKIDGIREDNRLDCISMLRELRDQPESFRSDPLLNFPFIDNLKKPANASKRDLLVLLILRYVESGFRAACNAGHISIVEMLIDKSEKEKNNPFTESLKFNFTAKNICGQTGFHSACFAGHTKVVEMLIDKSESLKLDLTAKDRHGYTGFQLAVKRGIVDVINLIKSKMPCLVI